MFRSAAVKTMIGLLLLIGVSWLGPLAAPANADVILPDEKPIDYCYTIANLSAYPDYTILAVSKKTDEHGNLLPSDTYFKSTIVQRIKRGECVDIVRYYHLGYRFSIPTLYAVKTSALPANGIPADPSQDPTFLSAHVSIYPVRVIKREDPRTKIEDVLTITALHGQTFTVERTGVRYTYAAGWTRDYPATDTRPDNQIDLSTNVVDQLPGWFAVSWYLLLPIGAALGMGIVLLRRRALRRQVQG